MTLTPQEIDKAELKPCPFWTVNEPHALTTIENEEGYRKIVCDCGASGPQAGTAQQARELWALRASLTPPAPAPETEGLTPEEKFALEDLDRAAKELDGFAVDLGDDHSVGLCSCDLKRAAESCRTSAAAIRRLAAHPAAPVEGGTPETGHTLSIRDDGFIECRVNGEYCGSVQMPPFIEHALRPMLAEVRRLRAKAPETNKELT